LPLLRRSISLWWGAARNVLEPELRDRIEQGAGRSDLIFDLLATAEPNEKAETDYLRTTKVDNEDAVPPM
jgi:hypothetical protein